MPHYKLVPSGKPELHADEIILSRDESGEVEHSLSIRDAREIPEELLSEAHAVAGRLGFKVAEAAPPEESEEEQPVGADSASGSPVVKQSGASSSEIDQQAQAGRAAQQDTAGATGAATTGSGTPSTSGTTNAPSGANPSNT